jgi:hypothetical protein
MTAKTPKNQNPESQENETTGPFVLVTTTHGQARRRAGMRFGPEGTRVDISTLSEAQKAAIQNDPLLKVKEFTQQNF